MAPRGCHDIDRHQSEARYRTVFDSSNDGIIIYDLGSRRAVDVNRATCEMFGYSRDEFLHLGVEDVITGKPPNTAAEIYDRLYQAASGSPQLFDLHARHRDGHLFWAEVNVKEVHIGDRDYLLGILRNVTERKLMEQQLRESEEKFRGLAETSLTAIFLQQDGRFIYVNPTAAQSTGYSRDELLGKKYWELAHPDSRDMVIERAEARLRGEPKPSYYEFKYLTKDGETRWAMMSAGLIQFRGRPAIIVNAVDITELKHTQQKLEDARAQIELYLDLMGHDINNMNQTATGYLEMALGTLDETGKIGPEDRRLLEIPLESLESSSGLISNVKKLRRAMSEGMKTMPVDVGLLLGEVCVQHAHAPGREVTLNCKYAERQLVLANELLRDVFSNLVTNAIKHSDPGRPLTIGIGVSPVFEEGREYSKIYIEDNGQGIPDDVKRTIFNRLRHVQNRPTRGGLGLYLVYTLVRQYHGRVWVEDRVPGDYRQGSRFVIMLPALQAKNAGAADEART